jgi:hypothetical protein
MDSARVTTNWLRRCCDAPSRIIKNPSTRRVLPRRFHIEPCLICIPTKDGQWKGFTMEFSRWQIFKSAAIVGIVGIASLALIHFIPTPPSKVVMAAGFKGASFEYY